MELKDEEKFVSRAYAKLDLARLYAPFCVSNEATMRYLSRLIHYNKQLVKELKQVNYNNNRHSFLRREVDLIVKHLGEP
jgi:hypothetical protein